MTRPTLVPNSRDMESSMTNKKTMIVLVQKESVLTSWLRDASTLALFVGLIGIGVYLESSAMQWSGAIIAFICSLAWASGEKKSSTYDIDGARAELDRLEADKDAV